MVTSGPSSSQLCGLQHLQPQPAHPTHESLSTPPPAPCCGCHRPWGAAIGTGGRLRANWEPPQPHSSSEPAEPAKEARPAGGHGFPAQRVPSLPTASLSPRNGPIPKSEGTSLCSNTRAPYLGLGGGAVPVGCQPGGASLGALSGHLGKSPSDKEPSTKLLCAWTC